MHEMNLASGDSCTVKRTHNTVTQITSIVQLKTQTMRIPVIVAKTSVIFST